MLTTGCGGRRFAPPLYRSVSMPAWLTDGITMNLDLEDFLEQHGVKHERFSKSEKVRLLARWVRTFPALVASARHGEATDGVARDATADERIARLSGCEFCILPDDRSGMPAYACMSETVPDLSELVSDTFTQCDELVVIDADFRWSAVYVNHGTPEFVGRHFAQIDADTEHRDDHAISPFS